MYIVQCTLYIQPKDNLEKDFCVRKLWYDTVLALFRTVCSTVKCTLCTTGSYNHNRIVFEEMCRLDRFNNASRDEFLDQIYIYKANMFGFFLKWFQMHTYIEVTLIPNFMSYLL